jgi:hypothetical protein
VGWSSIKVRGRLLIGGIGGIGGHEFDTTMASIAYELNNIPQATFAVEIGRNASKKLESAAIHAAAGSLSAETKLKYEVKLDYMDGSGVRDDLPKGWTTLFEGYLIGVSWQKLYGNAQVLLHARNWLLDMDYSSALSDSSHPTNPAQFSFKSVSAPAGTGLNAVGYTPLAAMSKAVGSGIQNDFWKEGLYKLFKVLTSSDQINAAEVGITGSGTNSVANSALDRFVSTAGLPANYVPLKFNSHGADAGRVTTAITDHISQQSFESFANTTLWGKLVGEYVPLYMIAVVPRISDALVIPYVPGLRRTHDKMLSGDDYAVVASNSELQRTLRGVGVFAGISWMTGADMSPGGSPKAQGIGGWYSPKDAKRGTVLFREAPPWLAGMTVRHPSTAKACGSGTSPIGTAFTPGESASADAPADATAPENVERKAKKLADAYAESLYVYELLRLRHVEFGGKLRFDIAPGSTIKAEMIGEKFVKKDNLAQDIVGDVLRVSYVFDSENSRASTNFNLAHVRTANENAKEGFSLEHHPLWQESWAGAGLL